jgi:hypothetical protein
MARTDFRYTKEMLFDEFKSAKEKDMALSKKKFDVEKENDIHINRIKLLKEYVELEAQSPEVFNDVNINFKNLLFAYEQPNPRDYFYYKVFGKSYSQKQFEDQAQTMADYEQSADIKPLEETLA